MQLTAINAVTLGVEDLGAARRFYQDFGLEEMEGGSAGSTFTSRDGSQIVVRARGDTSPPLVASDPTVREITWGVATASVLGKIAAELTRDRVVTSDRDGTLHSHDDDGYGIAFRPDTRRPTPVLPSRVNIYGGEPGRGMNSRIDFAEAIRPTSIAHVVVFSPDVPRATRFYTERLGFRITDRFLEGRGVFLRSAASRYHHNLFLIHSANRGLHHIAFPVTDFNEVMLGGQKMLAQGWTTKVGPGRHRIGSNFFWYFNSPCGGAMELTADMDCADDNWVAKDWKFEPENTAAWTLAFNPVRNS